MPLHRRKDQVLWNPPRFSLRARATNPPGLFSQKPQLIALFQECKPFSSESRTVSGRRDTHRPRLKQGIRYRALTLIIIPKNKRNARIGTGRPCKCQRHRGSSSASSSTTLLLRAPFLTTRWRFLGFEKLVQQQFVARCIKVAESIANNLLAPSPPFLPFLPRYVTVARGVAARLFLLAEESRAVLESTSSGGGGSRGRAPTLSGNRLPAVFFNYPVGQNRWNMPSRPRECGLAPRRNASRCD